MSFTFLVKLVVRGFLVVFVHLQHIELQLSMNTAAETIQSEIELFDRYRKEL